MVWAEHFGVFYVFQVFRNRSMGFVGGFGCESELKKRKTKAHRFSAFFLWFLNSCDFFRLSALCIVCKKQLNQDFEFSSENSSN